MAIVTRWYLICGDKRIQCSSEEEAWERVQEIENSGVCKAEHRVKSSTTESR